MWFRRKKKSEPDSALTETLRSLQVLLEDENSSNQRAEPTITKPTEGQSIAHPDFTFKDPVDEKNPTPSEGGDQRNLVQEENRAQMPIEGKADVATYENGATLTSSGEEITSQQVDPGETNGGVESGDSETQAVSGETDFWAGLPSEKESKEKKPWVDPFHSDDESQVPQDLVVELLHEDIPQDDIVIPAIDTIPVLTNVVYVPAVNAADRQVATTGTLAELIDASVNDLQNKLEQHNLTPMDSAQQTTLRRTLTQILSRNKTDSPH